MDFSIYDAIRAGFKRAILIIKGEHEKDFREVIGERLEGFIDIDYVHQELTYLPEGYSVPEGRTKPWGTTHAIWCCKDKVDAPFVVLNADDYYGPEAFVHMYNHLCKVQEASNDYAMVGYVLNNTLTDHGHVTRGVCQMEEGYLSEIVEIKEIQRKDGGVQYREDEEWLEIEANRLVSMNMWALTPAVFQQLEEAMVQFLEEEVPLNKEKSECLIPTTIGQLIKAGQAQVKVYQSNDTWQGVTYKEDKPMVMEALQALKDAELYPEKLWNR